jgi:GAF domain-containing protein
VQSLAWRTLSDAVLALHSEPSLDAVLRALADSATALVDAERSAVGVLDGAGSGFAYFVGHVELLEDPALAGGGTTLAVPIALRGRPYARLAVADKRGAGSFTRDDTDALELLAQHAAVAIENIRRYESAMRHLAQLEALDETANDLAGEVDLPRLLRGVAERLRELLRAASVLFFLPTPDGEYLEILAAAGEQRTWLGSRVPRKESTAGRVFDRGRSERVDDLLADPDVYQHLARPMKTRTALFVPLLDEQGSTGVIVATNKLGLDETFSVDDVRLAETFAARCAVAVRLAARGGSAREPEADDVERAGLTDREVEVLRLVANGMSDAEIAAKLVVSQRTVHSHLRSIYRKLHVGSRSEATRWAVERRLA